MLEFGLHTASVQFMFTISIPWIFDICLDVLCMCECESCDWGLLMMGPYIGKGILLEVYMQLDFF